MLHLTPSTHHCIRLTLSLLFMLGSPSVDAAKETSGNAGLFFTPAVLDFGNLAVGETRSLAVSFNNASGSTITLSNARIGGMNAAAFSLNGDCRGRLTSGKSCSLSVIFTADVPALRRADLNILTTQGAVGLPLLANRFNGSNDTGIATCSDSERNGLPCPVAGFSEQDAEFGRDKSFNDDSNGRAGFNFTKLDGNGVALPASATDWSCVRDNVAGLVWEIKPIPNDKQGDQGLHDADDTYTWYSSDTKNNGGNWGNPNPGNSCYGYSSRDRGSMCNTEFFVKRANQSSYCGANDWRLPTRQELVSLVDLMSGDPDAALDTRYFPDFNPGYLCGFLCEWMWSSTPSATDRAQSWAVNFVDGKITTGARSNTLHVRLVRFAK